MTQEIDRHIYFMLLFPMNTIQLTDVAPKLTLKQVAIISLMEHGFRDVDIVERFKVSRSYIQKIKRQLGINSNFDLTNLEPLAYKAIEHLVQGKPFGDIKVVKASTALAAAKEILKRTQPKIDVSVKETFHFSEIPKEFRGRATYKPLEIA
ncbi:MAG: hypothetical protein HQK91_07785 [Nitrospirae bacterium]|nr:hypothetical protein [Nitrospirota bacterium]